MLKKVKYAPSRKNKDNETKRKDSPVAGLGTSIGEHVTPTTKKIAVAVTVIHDIFHQTLSNFKQKQNRQRYRLDPRIR